MNKIIYAPDNPKCDGPTVFLAGTIDNGNSVNWQDIAAKELLESYNVYNPRRKEWDSSWEQSIGNQKFREQVEWELDQMERANAILFNFLGNSKSPITLLELGLWAPTPKKIVVCCEREFWRRGNVEVICERYNIDLYTNLASAIGYLL
jgi:hypothetical protein